MFIQFIGENCQKPHLSPVSEGMVGLNSCPFPVPEGVVGLDSWPFPVSEGVDGSDAWAAWRSPPL